MLASCPMMRAGMLLFALSLFACHGCNHDGGGPPAQSSGAPGATASGGGTGTSSGETVIHAEDDGKSFDVAQGSMVTFRLPANAGTGYTWTPAPGVDPNVLAPQGGPTNEPSSSQPGAPSAVVYHFLANAPGTANVEMDFKRPWGNQPPSRAVHVVVNVH
jgi:predicted secreted protein